MDLSIIIPIHNEEDNIDRLYKRIKYVMAENQYSHEIIFVDDGSTDHSLFRLKELLMDPCVKIIELSRNFGQHPALSAGFSVARGKHLVTMDADLQIDPGHIPALMDRLSRGSDFVSGIRRGRRDNFLFRRVPSWMMGLFLKMTMGQKVQDFGCPFNGLRRDLVEQFPNYGEMRRFLKPLALRLAQRVDEVEVEHEPRADGSSKYGFINLVDLFFDFVTNFSRHIFQRVMVLGLLTVFISLLTGAGYLIFRFAIPIIEQPMERLLGILFLGMVLGMQFILLGILGEFVIRIYRRMNPGPLYQIRRIWGDTCDKSSTNSNTSTRQDHHA